MREAWRIDEGVRDHRRLQVGEVTHSVDFGDLDSPTEGLDVFEEGVLDGVIDSGGSVRASAAGAIGRSEEM